MKTLTLTVLFAVANVGTTLANNAADQPTEKHVIAVETPGQAKRVEAFKAQLGFHRRNVEALWNQYELAERRIRCSIGNHADLERDRAFFIGVYQWDIDNNIRVAESRKAIAEINAKYEKAHKKRSADEALRIAVLQNRLKAEFIREARALKKTKHAYAALADTVPMLVEVEQYIAQSINRAGLLTPNDGSIATATH